MKPGLNIAIGIFVLILHYTYNQRLEMFLKSHADFNVCTPKKDQIRFDKFIRKILIPRKEKKKHYMTYMSVNFIIRNIFVLQLQNRLWLKDIIRQLKQHRKTNHSDWAHQTHIDHLYWVVDRWLLSWIEHVSVIFYLN